MGESQKRVSMCNVDFPIIIFRMLNLPGITQGSVSSVPIPDLFFLQVKPFRPVFIRPMMNFREHAR